MEAGHGLRDRVGSHLGNRSALKAALGATLVKNERHYQAFDVAFEVYFAHHRQLADEPCAGLNPAETQTMIDCLKAVRERGITVWLVEHDMRAVMSVCEHIFVIDAGRKIAEGTPREIVNDPRVVEAYLGPPAEEETEEESGQ